VTEDISSNGGELIIRNFLITLMQIPQNNDWKLVDAFLEHPFFENA
jgi:hypothetical protein